MQVFPERFSDRRERQHPDRTYQDKNGNNRKAFEIVADNVHFASSKSGGSTGTGSYAPRQEVPREAAQEAPAIPPAAMRILL